MVIPRTSVTLLTARIFRCPVEECRSNYIGNCRREDCNNYILYRKVTGRCEVCNAPIDGHPECEACGTLCGTGHIDSLPSCYRTREVVDSQGRVITIPNSLCGHCIKAWRKLEAEIGRPATYDEFINPNYKMFGKKYAFGDKAGWRGERKRRVRTREEVYSGR